MIWHIFKKDLRLSWRRAALVAVLQLMLTALWLTNPDIAMLAQSPTFPRSMSNVLAIAVVLGMAFVISSISHQDPVPGNGQDWLVRPIRRRDLLAAKLLGVMLLLQMPMLMADLAYAVMSGFSLGTSLTFAVSRNLLIFLVVSLPMLALSSLAKHLMELLGLSLSVLVVAAVVLIGSSLSGDRFGRINPTELTGLQWISGSGVILALALGAIAVLYSQYNRRNQKVGYLLVAATMGAFLSVIFFLPWNTAFAIQKYFSRGTSGASAVSVTFNPAIGARRVKTLDGESYDYLEHIPIQISGLPPNTALVIDRADAKSVSSSGKVKRFSEDTGLNFAGNGSGYLTLEMAAASEAAADQPLNDAELMVKPFRLEIDLWLTVLHGAGETPLRGVLGSFRGSRPPMSQCANWRSTITMGDPDSNGGMLVLDCYPVLSGPPCLSLVLKNLPSPWVQSPTIHCYRSYSPYTSRLWPGGDSAHAIAVFEDPNNGPGTSDAKADTFEHTDVALHWYEPVEHFKQTLVVPSMTLKEWMGHASPTP